MLVINRRLESRKQSLRDRFDMTEEEAARIAGLHPLSRTGGCIECKSDRPCLVGARARTVLRRAREEKSDETPLAPAAQAFITSYRGRAAVQTVEA